jgi:bifunctional ADP-heptose synthase (sugar kinase/adenylyltransferase)
MDTRTKIVRPETAPRGCTVVTGAFDVILAEDARELADLRAGGGERALLVVVLPVAGELFSMRARAELAAALRMVDYVVIADDAAPDALLASLEPAQLVRLEEVHTARKRQLMEHVQRRQTN